MTPSTTAHHDSRTKGRRDSLVGRRGNCLAIIEKPEKPGPAAQSPRASPRPRRRGRPAARRLRRICRARMYLLLVI